MSPDFGQPGQFGLASVADVAWMKNSAKLLINFTFDCLTKNLIRKPVSVVRHPDKWRVFICAPDRQISGFVLSKQ